jgi:hypothetical protein
MGCGMSVRFFSISVIEQVVVYAFMRGIARIGYTLLAALLRKYRSRMETRITLLRSKATEIAAEADYE